MHPVLRVAGLDVPRHDWDLIALRLGRTAVHARLLAASDRPLVLDPTAADALGDLLLAGVHALGGWQS